MTLNLSGGEVLRYGENSHQQAVFYRDGSLGSHVASAKQLQGKALSFNNIADTDAALECVREFETPACVIVKHANPVGVRRDQPSEAYDRAFKTDPTSAFGGIIAFNRPLDVDTAKAIIERQFVEVIIASGVSDDALAICASKQNVGYSVPVIQPKPAVVTITGGQRWFVSTRPRYAKHRRLARG